MAETHRAGPRPRPGPLSRPPDGANVTPLELQGMTRVEPQIRRIARSDDGQSCPRLDNVPRGDGRLSHDLLPGEKGPQDACGVFGVWAPGEEVAKLTYFGLYALQHRGQESAGIAVSNGSQILVFKDMGLVSQVFDETSLGSLTGHIAVGHARYSTTGASVWENAQPTFRATAHGSIALGHNGNLVNTAELAELVAAIPRPPAGPPRSPRPTTPT